MEFEHMLETIKHFISNETTTADCERFTEYYMDRFYDLTDLLESEVPKQIFEILDDINLICDAYEPHIGIRNNDKHCIDESQLKEKVSERLSVMSECENKK